MAQLFLAKPVSPLEIEEKHFAEERLSFADALRSARSIAQRLESTNQFNTEAAEIAEKPVIKMHFSVALYYRSVASCFSNKNSETATARRTTRRKPKCLYASRNLRAIAPSRSLWLRPKAALGSRRFFYSIRLARRVYSSSASRNFFLPSHRGDSFCLFHAS